MEMTLRIPDELAQELAERARENGRSRTKEIEYILRCELAAREREREKVQACQ